MHPSAHSSPRPIEHQHQLPPHAAAAATDSGVTIAETALVSQECGRGDRSHLGHSHPGNDSSDNRRYAVQLFYAS